MKAEITNNVGKFVRKTYSAADQAVYRAVMKSGGIVKKDAQRGAPSSKIAASLGVIGKNPKGEGPESHTGVKRGSKGWYGKFFESGAGQHPIEPKKGKMLAFLQVAGVGEFANSRGTLKRLKYFRTKTGYTLNASEGKIFLKKVDHPGMKAQPFLRPAFERNKSEIVKIVGEAIDKLNQQVVT